MMNIPFVSNWISWDDRRSAKTATRTAATSSLMAMPLELAENLDESKQWEVEVRKKERERENERRSDGAFSVFY